MLIIFKRGTCSIRQDPIAEEDLVARHSHRVGRRTELRFFDRTHPVIDDHVTVRRAQRSAHQSTEDLLLVDAQDAREELHESNGAGGPLANAREV